MHVQLCDLLTGTLTGYVVLMGGPCGIYALESCPKLHTWQVKVWMRLVRLLRPDRGQIEARYRTRNLPGCNQPDSTL